MDGLTDFKGFFFDLFGTLFVFEDFDKAHLLWVNAFYDLIGRTNGFSLDDMHNACDELFTIDVKKDQTRGLTTYETKIKSMCEKRGISPSRHELRDIADRTLEAWQNGITPAEDALRVLTELKKNRKIALITNFDHSPHVRKLIAACGLQNIFDIVIISDDVGYTKPQPEIFRLALRETDMRAQEVVHVGDSLHDDIQGALSSGIKPILIDRNMKSHADYHEGTAIPQDFNVIRSLSELLV